LIVDQNRFPMKILKLLLVATAAVFSLETASGQATFSIIAVDRVTGEVGIAGAGCVDTSRCDNCMLPGFVGGIVPGRGGLVAQGLVCRPHENLKNGLALLGIGNAPQAVLNYILMNDACNQGDAGFRQYGIVDFDPDGHPRSVGYTGINTDPFRGFIRGDFYCIQGNSLIGPEVLESMETYFLRTRGSLSRRLMAALQGANVPGADRRCLGAGTSSRAAFVQVAKPGDAPGNFFLDLQVSGLNDGQEPIDSLERLFNPWYVRNSQLQLPELLGLVSHAHPEGRELHLEWSSYQPGSGPWLVRLLNLSGALLEEQREIEQPMRVDISRLTPGNIYLLQLRSESSGKLFTQRFIL
jgi:uncharacterized Ntn-hydrolase superfamily protein